MVSTEHRISCEKVHDLQSLVNWLSTALLPECTLCYNPVCCIMYVQLRGASIHRWPRRRWGMFGVLARKNGFGRIRFS